MHLINLMVNYLYRKYGVPIYDFTREWTRVTRYLKYKYIVELHIKSVHWPDCKAIPAFGLMMSVCLSICQHLVNLD